MTPITLGQVMDHVRDLPALRQAAMDLVRSLDDPQLSLDELATKLAHDQALAARALRLANSSFYGLGRDVSALADATRVLGLRVLHTLATASAFMGGFPSAGAGGDCFHGFWRHALGTGLCTQALSQVLRAGERSACTAGLLHDIGRLALIDGFQAECQQVCEYQLAHDVPPLQAERAVLGFDHAELGGLLADHWRFDPALVQAIACHHEPQRASSRLCDMVHVADNMAHALDLSGHRDDMVPPLHVPSWLRLGLDHDRCIEVFRQTEAEHEALCQALLA